MEIQLTKNLKLTAISDNVTDENDNLVTVVCYFDFFGEEGVAYVGIKNLDSEWPSYSMAEISSELADSFNDLLEDEDNWQKIVAAIRSFQENEWKTFLNEIE